MVPSMSKGVNVVSDAKLIVLVPLGAASVPFETNAISIQVGSRDLRTKLDPSKRHLTQTRSFSW